MDDKYLQTVIEQLRDKGVRFEPGLSDAEIEKTESTFNFRFPPDLRAFLQVALPIALDQPRWSYETNDWIAVQYPFPNWRTDSEEALRERLDWPYEGMCFDIEHDAFWIETWGPKPAELSEAFAIARQKVDETPRLIPIFGHRYIPETPHMAGNPIFSVYQMDIIYYGSDLSSYFVNEFFRDHSIVSEARYIAFWSDFAEGKM